MHCKKGQFFRREECGHFSSFFPLLVWYTYSVQKDPFTPTTPKVPFPGTEDPSLTAGRRERERGILWAMRPEKKRDWMEEGESGTDTLLQLCFKAKTAHAFYTVLAWYSAVQYKS